MKNAAPKFTWTRCPLCTTWRSTVAVKPGKPCRTEGCKGIVEAA